MNVTIREERYLELIENEKRIDKAIEYIINYYFYNSIDFDVKELLDILKGSDKE